MRGATANKLQGREALERDPCQHHRPGRRLCHIGHVLMENRNGLAVLGEVTRATGTAEREAALSLIDGWRPGQRRITLGGDKSYDVAEFVGALRRRNVTPHIAIDGHPARPASRAAPPSMPEPPATRAMASAR